MSASRSAHTPRQQRQLPSWLKPRWLRRLGHSALIGGQAVAAIARGRIGVNDRLSRLFQRLPSTCDNPEYLLFPNLIRWGKGRHPHGCSTLW